MKVEDFINALNVNCYVGVPDSQLKALCNYLFDKFGVDSKHHMIAANEGNAVAFAAGQYLATGKPSLVYMQNSGEGNAINPIASLASTDVYAIPTIFVIGWRGEPGVNDEPQHVQQGKITIELLDLLEISSYVLDKSTTQNDLLGAMKNFQNDLNNGKSVAFIVRKGALEYESDTNYSNYNVLIREDILRQILKISKNDPIVSTTGKTSRELFELREELNQSHKFDFLTVGSMGHASSIALGIAMSKPEQRIWCIEGDGAVLMHMGALAVIGTSAPTNFIHVVINNEAHESVGGMPTAVQHSKLTEIALACGYKNAYSASKQEELNSVLKEVVSQEGPSFVEIKSAIGSRENLGRPTSTPQQNKAAFMDYLQSL